MMKWILGAVLVGLLCIGVSKISYDDGYKIGWIEGHARGYNQGVVNYETAVENVYKGRVKIKEVPWDEFDIKQKMLLCAYGSSGNRMSVRDIVEVISEFGPNEGFIGEWEITK